MHSDKERRNAIELEAARLCWKRANKTLILLVVLCIGAIISPIICINSLNRLNTVGYALGSQLKEIREDKPGKDVALQAANSWLTGSNTAFKSGVANLWWDSANSVSSADTSAGKQGVTYWNHTISFTDLADGSTRTITQMVSVKDGVATAVGSPTILPKTVTGSNTSNSYNPDNYLTIDRPETLNNVVKAWANAYLGKDVNALTVLVGDPDANHVFQPASVGTLTNASIGWLYECDERGHAVSKEQRSDNPEYGVASLSLSFTPYAKASSGDDSQTKQDDNTTATTSITVLIHNPTAGSARIVDWGADGNLTALAPYGNAIDKTAVSNGSTDAGNDEDNQNTTDTAVGQTTAGGGSEQAPTGDGNGTTQEQ